MEALAIPFLLLVGALLAVQAGANVRLSAAIGHPVGASALQLTIGAALLVALAAALGSLGKLGALDDVAGWHLVGGLGSAVYITAGILLFPRLGAVLTVGLLSPARCSSRSRSTPRARSASRPSRSASRPPPARPPSPPAPR